MKCFGRRRCALAWAIIAAFSLALCSRADARAQVPKAILKTFFEKGDKPTEQQFGTLIDSLIHQTDDGLTLAGIGATTVPGSSIPVAKRLGGNVGINESIPDTIFAAPSLHPEMAPLWTGQSGFLPLTYLDAASQPHYAFLQVSMDATSAPLGASLDPGPAIFVEYLVWETDPNTTLTTYLVPEPTAAVALAALASLALARVRRRVR